ncbi:MAG: Hydroxylamine reductase [Spirochaetes bacterium ADurb.Bin269]|nr:MAG: Hydroxylamine reductase [Spirochaetes bacterium ADurb.Bin269]
MSMFCFQCEQTAGGKACTVNGVCGKKENTANLQDKMTGKLVALAKLVLEKGADKRSDELMIDGLFTGITNVSFDDGRIAALEREFDAYIASRASGARYAELDLGTLWNGPDEDVRSLKSLLLFGMRGMAAYAHHAAALGKTDRSVNDFFYKGMAALDKNLSVPELLDLNMEFGGVNLKCMELLDAANTGTYGTPEPTTVTTNVAPGPFIVVSGHDLHDLAELLEQVKGTGVSVYTHGEMLPCHAYPELKKHPALKGNFGTAWQNQQKEFDNVPGAFLFTTNCLMPVKASYADRVFTTSVVAYPELVHIPSVGGKKDFGPVIKKALDLGGFKQEMKMTGINGGSTLTCGFGHGTVLSVADKVIDAVKAGAIKHFFLVGGCDGAKPGRNYYTDFVRQSPKDTVILTLACGKFRFNDLDLGTIGGLPRIMDMGQCNDAYSAIRVALALADAFKCGVNELPLTLVLSWYEQKAVCILLTLLSLGIKNIYLGPTLPAFVSSNVLKVLVEKWNVTPISTPEADLKKILG